MRRTKHGIIFFIITKFEFDYVSVHQKALRTLSNEDNKGKRGGFYFIKFNI